MNKLRYKGYVGSVEVSEEDNCLYGHVLDLPHETEITYEGGTVAQLKEDFMNAVDDYIAYCESKCYHQTQALMGATRPASGISGIKKGEDKLCEISSCLFFRRGTRRPH